MKGIMGKKLGMTQIFGETGELVAVTVIEATPNVVVQKKTVDKEGYDAVQLGFEPIRYESGEEHTISDDEAFSAVVFKTITDPYVGKISIYKVLSGTMTKDTALFNSSQDADEKNTGPFVIRGKEQIPVDVIHAGDIGAISKLNVTKTGDTLCDKAHNVVYKRVKMPQPVYF